MPTLIVNLGFVSAAIGLPPTSHSLAAPLLSHHTRVTAASSESYSALSEAWGHRRHRRQDCRGQRLEQDGDEPRRREDGQAAKREGPDPPALPERAVVFCPDDTVDG